MDLELDIDIQGLARLLEEIGFEEVKVERGVLEAKVKMGWGRIHVLAKEIATNRVYADVHWDALIHFLMLGVDYAERPKRICEVIIEKMRERGMRGRIIGGTSWFNRRNKAVISGLKI